MEFNIRAKHNGWCCIFNLNGQEYYASLIFGKDDKPYSPECMIFKSEDGQFSFKDAGGVYFCDSMSVSPIGLEQCIKEFIALQQ